MRGGERQANEGEKRAKSGSDVFGFVRYESVSKRQYRYICIYEHLRTRFLLWICFWTVSLPHASRAPRSPLSLVVYRRIARNKRNGRHSAFGGPVQSASFVQCTNPSCSLRAPTSISSVAGPAHPHTSSIASITRSHTPDPHPVTSITAKTKGRRSAPVYREG
jgi:hypothetical protein